MAFRTSLDTRPAGLTANQSVVWDLAECFVIPPDPMPSSYRAAVTRAARFVDTGVVETRPVVVVSGSSAAVVNATMASRNAVFARVAEVEYFASRARAAGFSPPDNPFAKVTELVNAQADFSVTSDVADVVVFNAQKYLQLLAAEKSGELDITKVRPAQLSSVAVSLSGVGTNSGVASELLKYLPDADQLKEQKAQQLLAALDFTKRLPRVLFTLERVVSGKSACVVCWKKIHDASGYLIRRQSLYGQKLAVAQVTNADLLANRDSLAAFVTRFGLSFYDNVSERDVEFYLDESVERDEFYLYTVTAFQDVVASDFSVFDPEVVAANLSVAQRARVQEAVRAASIGRGVAAVSPYPFIAQEITGDKRLDWALAGVNVRASILRGDDRGSVRSYSYVGAQSDFLFSQMDKGLFFVPRDSNAVPARVRDSIAQHGVFQTISSILSQTGTLFFFEGRDVKSPVTDVFAKAGEETPETSAVLSAVLSSIDADSATIDARTLATNLPSALRNGVSDDSDVTRPRVGASPSEINVADPNSASEDPLQFASEAVSGDLIDLTTFEGIDRMMNVIRAYSDYGPPSFGVARPSAGVSVLTATQTAAFSSTLGVIRILSGSLQ